MKLAGDSKERLNIRNKPEGIVFNVLVQPRSSKNMIVGLHDGALKIKLTAPPVDNAANRMCLKFIAKCLGVSRSSLEIVTGHNSRHKQILLRSDQTKTTAGEHKHLRQIVKRFGISTT
jgi:uncharacterized protein (TIGR00251 family)